MRLHLGYITRAAAVVLLVLALHDAARVCLFAGERVEFYDCVTLWREHSRCGPRCWRTIGHPACNWRCVRGRAEDAP